MLDKNYDQNSTANKISQQELVLCDEHDFGGLFKNTKLIHLSKLILIKVCILFKNFFLSASNDKMFRCLHDLVVAVSECLSRMNREDIVSNFVGDVVFHTNNTYIISVLRNFDKNTNRYYRIKGHYYFKLEAIKLFIFDNKAGSNEEHLALFTDLLKFTERLDELPLAYYQLIHIYFQINNVRLCLQKIEDEYLLPLNSIKSVNINHRDI